MKKTYEGVTGFVRMIVTGVVSFIAALPTFTSLGASL